MSWELTAYPPAVHVHSIFGFSDDKIYAVGYNPDSGMDTASRWNGSAWNIVGTISFDDGGTFNTLWGFSDAKLWSTVGWNSLRYSTDQGATWSVLSTPPPLPVGAQYNSFIGMWGTSATDFWISGYTQPTSFLDLPYGNIAHTTDGGTTWTSYYVPESFNFNCIYGKDSNDIYFGSAPNTGSPDGVSISPVAALTTAGSGISYVTALWVSSSGVIFVSGPSSTGDNPPSILRSTDNFATWDTQVLFVPDGAYDAGTMICNSIRGDLSGNVYASYVSLVD